MDCEKMFDDLERQLKELDDELALFLGPDTKEKKAYLWCNADRRSSLKGPCPTLEELM